MTRREFVTEFVAMHKRGIPSADAIAIESALDEAKQLWDEAKQLWDEAKQLWNRNRSYYATLTVDEFRLKYGAVESSLPLNASKAVEGA